MSADGLQITIGFIAAIAAIVGAIAAVLVVVWQRRLSIELVESTGRLHANASQQPSFDEQSKGNPPVPIPVSLAMISIRMRNKSGVASMLTKLDCQIDGTNECRILGLDGPEQHRYVTDNPPNSMPLTAGSNNQGDSQDIRNWTVAQPLIIPAGEIRHAHFACRITPRVVSTCAVTIRVTDISGKVFAYKITVREQP